MSDFCVNDIAERQIIQKFFLAPFLHVFSWKYGARVAENVTLKAHNVKANVFPDLGNERNIPDRSGIYSERPLLSLNDASYCAQVDM